MFSFRKVLLCCLVLVLSACATTQHSNSDPFEKMNRGVFTFNDKLDRYMLKPIAQGYEFVVPSVIRQGITNAFSNVNDLYNAANHILQLNIAAGASDLMRFVMNTVFGLGGLFDFATLANLPKNSTDFGITLAHYGMPAGPYLVLPVFGPSSLRDAAGLGVSYFINPTSYINPTDLSWGVYGLQLVNTRTDLLGTEQVIDGAAIDRYSFLRDAYLQRRQYLKGVAQASGSESDYHDVPDYSKALEESQPALKPN